MRQASLADIPPFIKHPDVEILQAYDHPRESLRGWHGTLTAKAWIDGELVCFFVGEEKAERYVLFFEANNEYRPRFNGADMRRAEIGAAFALDVFVVSRVRPITDSVVRLNMFP